MTELIQPYNEYLLLLAVIFGVINTALLSMLLIKKIKLEKENMRVAEKLVAGFTKENDLKGPTVFNIKGFIDGGVIIALFGVAIIAFITGREMVPKESVKNKEEIKIDDSVYQCKEIKRKMLRYYDPETGRYKYLPLNPNEGCQ